MPSTQILSQALPNANGTISKPLSAISNLNMTIKGYSNDIPMNGNGGHSNGSATNGSGNHGNGISTNGDGVHLNGANGNGVNGVNDHHIESAEGTFSPIAICGMACRLPGGIASPEQLWDFLIKRGDARSRVPESRFNISAYHSAVKKAGAANTEFGYFLDNSVDLGALDTSFFSMPRNEVARLDPQQRLLLEVARESIDDAGEIGWKGSNIGVYVGTFSQDWYDAFNREPLKYGIYQATTTHDFMISERLSHEMDLRGPRYATPFFFFAVKSNSLLQHDNSHGLLLSPGWPERGLHGHC